MNYTNVSTSTLDVNTVYLYVIEGSILLGFNGCFCLLILNISQLSRQKEFIIFAINMFSDALFGSAYLVAGIYNLSVYYNEQCNFIFFFLRQSSFLDFPWLTRFYCFFRPHVQLFVIVTPMVGLVSLANATDRLLSVFKPVQYFYWSRKYAFILGAFAFAGVIPVYIISLLGAYETKDTLVNGLCLLQYAVVPLMYSGMRMVRIVSSIVGALLYIPILFKLKQVDFIIFLRFLNSRLGHKSNE